MATTHAVGRLHHPRAHPNDWRCGSSLIATVLLFTGREEGVLASIIVGLAVAGFIVVEVVRLKQEVSWTLGLYFGLCLALSGLAISLWMARHRAHRLKIKHT